MKLSLTRLIRIQLVTGDPEGLRSASIAGRTTEISGCPWTDLPTLLRRPEAERPAVYFLIGTPLSESQTEGLQEAIYVGECDSLKDRFSGKHHKQEAADWTQIFLATETGDTFNKAHGRLAEHLLTRKARDAGRALVLTRQTSEGNISDGDTAFTQEFVENVVILAQVLGVTLFRPSIHATKSLLQDQPGTNALVSSDQIWVYRYGKQAVSEKMVQDGKRFVILAGSETRATPDPVGQYFGKSIRTAAIEAGALVKDEKENVYRFVKDFQVGSLSAAAAAIYGQNATGPDAWYDEKTNMSYRDWLNKKASTAAEINNGN